MMKSCQWCAYLLWLSSVLGDHGNHVIQDVHSPQQVVQRFVERWIAADLEGMYSFLDHKTQTQISLKQIQDAFLQEIPQEAHCVMGVLLLADPKHNRIVNGRPAELSQVRLVKQNKKVAYVDVKVRVTFASRTGIDPVKLFLLFLGDKNPLLSLIPESDRTRIQDQLNQQLHDNDQSQSAAFFFWGIALPDMVKGDVIDTAVNQKEVFVNRIEDREIIFNLHRYKLIYENDAWKIANAITMQKASKSTKEKPNSPTQHLIRNLIKIIRGGQ